VQVRRRPQAAAGRKRGGAALGTPRALRHPGKVAAYGQRESPPPAAGVAEHAASAAGGTAHDQGPAVTAGRRPPRPRLPDPVGPEDQQPPGLRGRAPPATADQRPRLRARSRCVEAARVRDGWPDRTQEGASGGDQGPADPSAAHRHGPREALGPRWPPPRSRATVVRRGDLPHAHGPARPRGRPALADPRGPLACATRGTAIDAPDVLEGRDGARAGRGALEAVRARTCARPYGREGALGEAASTGGGAPRDPPGRVDRVRGRRDDRAVLHRRRPGLQAGMVDPAGQGVHPETGRPQGGTVSPVLAQVARPEALDLWWAHGVPPRGRGAARWCREAADWGGACRVPEDAARWGRGRPNRRAPCHRHVAPAHTPLGRCRRWHPRTTRRGPWLGGAWCWPPERHGGPRVRRRPARPTLPAACPRRPAGIPPPRQRPGRAGFPRLPARGRGHDNDAGVRGNARALTRVFHGAMDGTFPGRNRRGGQRRRDPWEQGTRVRDRVKSARPRLTDVPRRRVCAGRLGGAPRKRGPPRNRMRDNGPSGSARGGPGNRHSYRRGVHEKRKVGMRLTGDGNYYS